MTTQIRVPAAILGQYCGATWYLGVSSYAYLPITVQVGWKLEGYCPNDCSQHGECFLNNYVPVCVCYSGWNGGGCDVTDSNMPTDDNVSNGVTVALVFVFLFLGVLVGIGIKAQFPQLCAKKDSGAIGDAQRVDYSAMGADKA